LETGSLFYFRDTFVYPMRILSNPVVRFIFFGNYHYGVCAIALAIEAVTQQQVPLPHGSFFNLLATATIWYYLYSYRHSNPKDLDNKRVVWYFSNKKMIDGLQIFHATLIIMSFLIFLKLFWGNLSALNTGATVVLIVFPLVAVFYYGAESSAFGRFNLRQLGPLKPFIIGFVWAGPVTLYPVLFSNIENGVPYQIALVGSLLFLKNFMFIAMLSIMFDIKDYAHDHRQSLGTFVTRTGLRKTIFTILVPLSVLGLGTFITYGITRDFSAIKIILNTIPFVFLMVVAWSLAKRKSILYYLIVVDGLMVVKAVCGTVAMVFF
jgi:hypothetical protein